MLADEFTKYVNGTKMTTFTNQIFITIDLRSIKV